MEQPQLESVSFPKITMIIDLAGTNSLIGALAEKLLEKDKDLLKAVGRLQPEGIEFKINKVHPDLNLYEEINKVRDIFKIEETKITVFILR